MAASTCFVSRMLTGTHASFWLSLPSNSRTSHLGGGTENHNTSNTHRERIAHRNRWARSRQAYLGSLMGDGDCGLALRRNRADVCVFFGLTDSLCLAAECSSNWPGISASIEFRSASILADGFGGEGGGVCVLVCVNSVFPCSVGDIVTEKAYLASAPLFSTDVSSTSTRSPRRSENVSGASAL